VKDAVAAVPPVMVNEQVGATSDPAQPLHAWNAYPALGVSWSDTNESSGKFAVHVPDPIPATIVQLMPGGVETTVPLPCPDTANGTPDTAVAFPLK
jgi:hypothetical protein